MFKVIEHHIESGLDESEALDKARTIYNSIKRPSGKKPGIKDLNIAFKKEMDRLGIKSTGRPRKAQRSSNKRRRNTSISSEHFANAFQLSPEEEQVIADERKQQEMMKRQMEQQQQQANNQARWDYAHRNYQGSYPAIAPNNYGAIHALPFRPYPGQPEIPLPPGHQYATIPNS
jgi:hypothetical protein